MTTATITQRSLTAGVRQYFVDMLGQQIDLELSTTDLNFILGIVKKTDDQVEGVQREEQKILANRELSDDGKSKALAALADRSTGSFAFLERIVRQHEEQIRTVEQKLYSRLSPPQNEQATERLIRELRAAEIRAALEGDNHDAAFLQALEKGDFETIHALLTAPGGSWVSDEILERGKAEYAKRVDPVALAGMTSLGIVKDRIEGVLSFVKTWLLKLGASETTILKHLG